MANTTIVPTKGRLMSAKRSLEQAKLGYELMDRKRNILIRELVQLLDQAKKIRGKIEDTYTNAYRALQNANITLGICGSLARSVPLEESVSISYRSVMGVEIPSVRLEERPLHPEYGFQLTNSHFDDAYICFNKVKELTAVLAEVENSVYRLAVGIKRTQKRANALANILIPRFEGEVKAISDALEEKEREEFSRQKVIKRSKLRKEEQRVRDALEA